MINGIFFLKFYMNRKSDRKTKKNCARKNVEKAVETVDNSL